MDDSQQRNPIEVLADEFVQRFREGESPSLDEYLDRYPELATEINDLFPLMVEMEVARSADSLTASTTRVPFVTPEIKQLGDYRIVREIGRGGMGIVYEAEQVSLGRRVALKVLPTNFLGKPHHQSRFQRESKAAASLHHTNIVPVFGVGEEDGLSYYVMQLIDGHGLDDVLSELKQMSLESKSGTSELQDSDSSVSNIASQLCGSSDSISLGSSSNDTHPPVNSSTLNAKERRGASSRRRKFTYWDNVARIGTQVANALDHAHKQGVLHRDVKPANLLLDMSGNVWVTDFGLASLESDHRLTETGDVLGTLRYMAPEALKGRADARSEVFSLGLTLYELLVWSPAYDQENRNKLIDGVLNVAIEPIAKLRPEVPSDLQTIVHKAIERDPEHRYQNAEQLADDLTCFLNDQPIKARRVSLPERFFRWRRQNRGLAALAVSLILVVTLTALGSSIAAGYLLNLSNQLDSTVEELSSSRTLAENRADENLKLAQQADEARRLSDETLADMYTQRGVLTGHEGDSAGAALWFANAASLVSHDQERQAENRLRSKNWLSQAVVPLATYKLKSANQWMLLNLKFQPHGSLLMMRLANRLRIWDWRRDEFLSWPDEFPPVSSVSWSPDGKYVAVACDDGTVSAHEVRTGKIVFHFKASGKAGRIAWAPNGSLFATANATDAASDNELVQIWDIKGQPKLVNQWDHPKKVYGLTFNQASDRLATACEDRQARLFVVGTSDGQTPLWGPVTHDPARFFDSAKPVFFDGDEKLATVDGHRPIWRNVETGEDVTPQLEVERPGFTLCLAASGDGEWIAAGGRFSTMLWNVRGESFRLYHGNNVRDVRFDHQSQSLLSLSLDGMAQRWTLPPKSEAALKFPQPEKFQVGSISTDGQQMATGGIRQVTIWGMPEGSPLVGEFKSWGNGRWRPRISSDGQVATPGAHYSQGRLHFSERRQLNLVRLSDGFPAGPTIQLDGGLIDSCFCSDGHKVASACKTGNRGFIAIHEIATGKRMVDPIGLSFRPIRLTARPGTDELAILGGGGELVMVSVHAATVDRVFKLASWSGDANGFCRVDYTPDGTTLIAVTPKGKIEVLDADSGERRFAPISPIVQAGPMRTLEVSTDSRWLATGVNGKNVARVWDLQSGKPAGPAIPHSGNLYGISSVAFSPNGHLLLTGHHDGKARSWDWRTGELLVSPMAHPDDVMDVEVTNDGRFALTGLPNGKVFFWSLATGRMVAPPAEFQLPAGAMSGLAISGDRLLVGAAPKCPLVNLSNILEQPKESTASLLNAASVMAIQKHQFGEMTPLEIDEWLRRCAQYRRQKNDDSVQDFVARLDRADDLHSIQRIAEQLVRSGFIEQLVALRPKVPQLHHALATDCQSRGDEDSAGRHFETAMALIRAQLGDLKEDSQQAIDLNTELATLVLERHAPKPDDHQLSEPAPENELHDELQELISKKRLMGKDAVAAAWIIVGQPEFARRLLEESQSLSEHSYDQGVQLTLQAIAYRDLRQHENRRQVSLRLIDWLGRETLPSRLRPIARRAVILPDDFSLADFNELLVREYMEKQLAQLSDAIDRKPNSRDAYTTRAYFLKRFGKWDLAAADLLKATEIDEDDRILFMNAASTFLSAGDQQSYQKVCQKMQQRFGDTDQYSEASVLIKTCCILPEIVELSELPINPLRQGVADQSIPFWHYHVSTLALYSYRSADYEAAIELTDNLTKITSNAILMGTVVRAMAQYQLGQTEKARKTLKRAEALINPMMRTLGTDAYDGPIPVRVAPGHDDQIAEILRREAVKLLQEGDLD